MAKEKIDDIGENQKEKYFTMSGSQLFETRKNRELITGSLSLDIALGGGIPRGCTCILGGRYGCGKTTASLQYAANAQNKYGCKVFFANIEGRIDNKVLSQIRGIKLDSDNFEVIMGPPIYDSKDKKKIIGHKKMTAEFWYQIIGNLITNNPGCIIIVDSISALSDERELSEEVGYQSRGGINKIESQFCRKFGDMIMSSGTTVFILAQLIANVTGYGDPIAVKCGSALRHLCDLLLVCKKIEKWKPSSEEASVLGQDLICTIEKSPLGPPYTNCSVSLRYRYGLDDIKDLVDHAINWDIIKKSSSWFELPFVDDGKKVKYIEPDKDEKDKDIKLIKLQGEAAIRDWFIDHPNEAKLIEDKIRKMVLG